MPAFTLAEPTAKNMVKLADGPFKLGSLPSPICDIARVLTGSVDFHAHENGKAFKSRRNYLNGAQEFRTPASLSGAVSEHVTPELFQKFLNRVRYKNIGFFNGLRDEISQAIYYHHTENNVESFVHTYRSIEFIAEACGLLYVTYQDDFTKSMAFFRSIYTDENMGPIGLLSQTLDKIAESENLESVTFDFSPSNIPASYVGHIGSQLRRIGVPEMNGVSFTWDENDGYIVSVRFAEVARFISTVRNRTYHNYRSGANIALRPIGGLSPLTGMLVPPTLSWIATLYFTLLRALVVREADSYQPSDS